MAGLKDITDEELLKLAGEAGIETVDQKQGNLQNLSDEELLALADESGVSTAPKLPATAVPEITSAESFARGAIQGATLGFADEISGAFESALSDKPFEQARNESRQNFEAAQQANPNAYIIGEVGGGIASTFATGGLSAGYRGAAIVGGMAGIGFSNRTGSALLKDAAIGASFGMAGEKVAKGIGRFTQKFFQRSSNVTKKVFEDLGETTRPENVKFEASLIKDAFNGRLGSADEWVVSGSFGEKVQKGLDETPELMKSIFRDKRKQLGEEIGAIVDDLQVKDVDMSDLVDGFKKGLREELVTSGSDAKAMKIIKEKILDPIDEGTFAVTEGKILNTNQMTPMEATSFKRGVQDVIFNEIDIDGSSVIQKSPRALRLLNQLGADITERANSLDPSGRLRAVNQQFSQLAQAESLIPKSTEAHKLLRLQDPVSPTKAGSEMRQLNQLLEGVDPEFRAMVVKEINPRLAAFKLHQAANFQGGVVSTAFRAKAGSAAGGGFGPIGEAAGFVLGAGEAMAVNTANAIGRARKAFKIPRSLPEIFANSDIIISKLSQVSPAAAIALNDAVATGDENAVEEIIKQVMQVQGAQAEFEQGVGFNGKAVTPEEFENARSQIMSSSMPLSEKIVSVNQLEADGTIPLPEQLAPRFTPSRMNVERDKNIENMNKVKLLEKGLK